MQRDKHHTISKLGVSFAAAQVPCVLPTPPGPSRAVNSKRTSRPVAEQGPDMGSNLLRARRARAGVGREEWKKRMSVGRAACSTWRGPSYGSGSWKWREIRNFQEDLACNNSATSVRFSSRSQPIVQRKFTLVNHCLICRDRPIRVFLHAVVGFQAPSATCCPRMSLASCSARGNRER